MLGGKTPTRLTKGVAMSIPSVNFISYNSTGINSVKTKWIRELCDITDSSYICIQEHFKNSKSQICAPRKNTGKNLTRIQFQFGPPPSYFLQDNAPLPLTELETCVSFPRTVSSLNTRISRMYLQKLVNIYLS